MQVVLVFPTLLWCLYAGCVGIPGAGVQEEDLSEGPESTPQQIQPGNCLNGLTFKTIIA